MVNPILPSPLDLRGALHKDSPAPADTPSSSSVDSAVALPDPALLEPSATPTLATYPSSLSPHTDTSSSPHNSLFSTASSSTTDEEADDDPGHSAVSLATLKPRTTAQGYSDEQEIPLAGHFVFPVETHLEQQQQNALANPRLPLVSAAAAATPFEKVIQLKPIHRKSHSSSFTPSGSSARHHHRHSSTSSPLLGAGTHTPAVTEDAGDWVDASPVEPLCPSGSTPSSIPSTQAASTGVKGEVESMAGQGGKISSGPASSLLDLPALKPAVGSSSSLSSLSRKTSVTKAAKPRVARGISAHAVIERLKKMEAGVVREGTSTDGLIVVDVRNLSAFLGDQGRIKGSINVNFPSLLIKRFRKGNTGNFTLSAFISTAQGIQLWSALVAAHGVHVQDLDILIVDQETVSQKESSAGNVLMTVLERRDEKGQILYLEGSWDDLVQTQGANEWIVMGEGEDAEGTDEEPATEPSSPQPLHLPVLPKRAQSLYSSSPFPSPILSLGPNHVTRSPTTTVMSPPPLYSPSFRVPLLSPRTPGGTRRGPKLVRLDTSDHLLKNPPRPPSHANTCPPAISTPSLSGTTTPVKAKKRIGNILVPPLMSIQSLCHSQAQSPVSTTRFRAPHSPLLRTQSPQVPRNPNDWSSPLTPKTDTSLPPFCISTVLQGTLYLGPAPTTQEHVDELLALGITQVLNMALECTDCTALLTPALAAVGGTYHKIPLRDFVEEVEIPKSIEEGCRILQAAEKEGKVSYVHCWAGKSRSVMIVLAWLIRRNGWSLKKAFSYLGERRPGISPNIGFISELMKFEERQRGERSRGVFGPATPHLYGSPLPCAIETTAEESYFPSTPPPASRPVDE